jgi:hypothetical protein
MFLWRGKKTNTFSISFWKKICLGFGKKLWVYHDIAVGNIETSFSPPAKNHYKIPLASVTGGFSFPPKALKFEYTAIAERAHSNPLLAREEVQKFIEQNMKGEVS